MYVQPHDMRNHHTYTTTQYQPNKKVFCRFSKSGNKKNTYRNV
jgi:hypothetical protein